MKQTMDILLKLYREYLKTITSFRFDPIILLISSQIVQDFKKIVSLYLIMVIIFHLPLVVLNALYKKK